MPINVFLVDDSATVRTVLKMILEKDPEICVLGVAANAEIALKKNGQAMARRYCFRSGNAWHAWPGIP
jgi:chemotaxis response regulator CheB